MKYFCCIGELDAGLHFYNDHSLLSLSCGLQCLNKSFNMVQLVNNFCCYVNCDDNNWRFHANLSLGVLPVRDGDSAHIGNMQKHKQSNYTKLTVAKGSGSSYQPLRYWWSCVSGKQATVNTCQLLRDNNWVLSRKGDSGTVLSSASKKASRSDKLWSERRLIGTNIGVDQG